MNEWALLGVGVAAAMSPCPMATNLAAVGYISRHVGAGRRSLLCALLYAAGRMAAYTTLGLAITAGLVGMPALSYALQTRGPLVLGPLMLLAGLVLLDILPLPGWLRIGTPGKGTVDGVLGRGGVWGAFPLGALFALALCPPSAALFFGGALPLAAECTVPLPVGISIFGLGTALPVMLLALGLSLGAGKMAAVFRCLPAIQRAFKLLGGLALLGLGLWECLQTFILN